MNKKELDLKYRELRENLLSAITDEKNLAVVEAPPGSGKTYMLLAVVAELVSAGHRIAIAAQTNRQADDIAIRWNNDYGHLSATRLGSSNSKPPEGFPKKVNWLTNSKHIPEDPGLVISTASKWTMVKDPTPFYLLAIDEAWQMAWGDFMQCSNLSEKFFLIGDPGQIPPVVTIDVRRWATSPRPPHKPAPEVVKTDPELEDFAFVGSLPACRRLPNESVKYVKPFYTFDFDAYAEVGERRIDVADSLRGTEIGDMVQLLETGQPVIATLPTPEEGLPAETDSGIATKIVEILEVLLHDNVDIAFSPKEKSRKLTSKDIGVCSTHRAMNGEITKALGARYSDVSVDTPERWQGLERPVMIVVHPLSNVTEPSDFDLETGRLCVMASRHQIGLVVLTRDHVGKSLEEFIPQATQAPGQPDIVGRGHFAHSRFWNELKQDGRIVALSS